MISQLASPTVCVVDDEPADFGPILAALNGLYIGGVHFLGTVDSLPPEPFKGLRLVFFDLHLSTSVGKDAASYAANVFCHIVSPDTAPVVVVIWSKYAGDKLGQDDLPPEDQETESELFKRTLLDAAPEYDGRLLFVEMAKPKAEDRPEDWALALKTEISNALMDQEGVDTLWSWETIVKRACSEVASGLTTVAQRSDRALAAGLKATMQSLAAAQAESDMSAATAPRHLTTALSELLADQLEHDGQIGDLLPHGEWLSEQAAPPLPDAFGRYLNGLLLTAGLSNGGTPFPSGTIYKLRSFDDLGPNLGVDADKLFGAFCKKTPGSDGWNNLKAGASVVFLELSPVCDVAQGKRISSLLVAGLLVPVALKEQVKSQGPMSLGADFDLRWEKPGFPAQAVALVVHHAFRVTIPQEHQADWLEPWFRLRELPATMIRNANAAHASRVGFVSVG